MLVGEEELENITALEKFILDPEWLHQLHEKVTSKTGSPPFLFIDLRGFQAIDQEEVEEEREF